jgi:hypothetical protein
MPFDRKASNPISVFHATFSKITCIIFTPRMLFKLTVKTPLAFNCGGVGEEKLGLGHISPLYYTNLLVMGSLHAVLFDPNTTPSIYPVSWITLNNDPT